MVTQFTFLFIAGEIFRDMEVKSCQCYCKKQINNNFPWFVLLSTIDMTSKRRQVLDTNASPLSGQD